MSVGREILASRAGYRYELVDVPEWGGQTRIRELSAAEAARVQKIALDAIDREGQQVRDALALAQFQAAVVVAGWVDDAGANVLAATDLAAVQEQPAGVVARLANAILALSGMEAAPLEAAKNA